MGGMESEFTVFAFPTQFFCKVQKALYNKVH